MTDSENTALDLPAPPDRPELPDAATAPEDRLAPWPWYTGLVGLAVALGIAVVLGAIIAGVGAAFGASATDPPPAVSIASVYVQDIVFVLVAFGAVRVATGRRVVPATLGLRRTSPFLAAGLVVGAYIAFLVFTGVWTSLLGINDRDSLPESLGVDSSHVALAAVALVVCVGAPVGEELLFRGLIFTSLRRLGLVPAVLGTGVLFGLVHVGGSPIGFIVPLIVLGCGFCLIYLRTRSLWPCMSLHAINNSVAYGVGVGWSWQVPLLALGALAVLATLFLAVDRLGSPRIRTLPAQ